MTATVVAPARRGSLEPYLFDAVEFYEHQVDGIRWLARQRNFLLADQMGLGKSLQALTVFSIDVKMGLGNTMIVVCPVSLRANWEDEIKKFTSFRYMLLGQEPHPTKPGESKTLQPKARLAQIMEFMTWEGPKILICNYEQVVAHQSELQALKARLLICDEAHYLKTPNSKRTMALHSLVRHCERVALLTGTPVLNRVDELWSLLHMIDPSGWPSYRRFVNRYCSFGGFNGKQIIGSKNVNELNKVLAGVMLRRLKKDVLQIPEPRIITVPVDLHPTQRALYDQLYDDMILPDANGDPQDIDNALVKFLRLKQICGSSATIPGQPDHSHKLDRAVEIIKELLDNGEKVVVFTQFRDIQDLVVQRLTKAGVNMIAMLSGDVPPAHRVPVVKDWSSWPDPAPIVCMLQVAGVGLNMTAAKNAVFIDKLFVPGLNNQAIDRIHRIGQSTTQPVTIYEMIARGTIESRVEQILKGKDQMFTNVVEETSAFRKLMEQMKQVGGH